MTCVCGSARIETVAKALPQRIGRYTVTNQFGRAEVCADCGEWTISREELSSLGLHAVVVTFHDAEITKLAGAELRDARKVMGLTQTELALTLGVSVGTISRWENDHEALPEWIKPAISGVARNILQPMPAGPTLQKSA